MSGPREHAVATGTHGRYLVDAPAGAGSRPLLIGFHGYGENAAVHLAALARLDPVHEWIRVSVQGLHRFYSRRQEVVASWMTREDRELAITDNIGYAAAVRAAVARDYASADPLVTVGFSQGVAQGVAQAYRAGLAAGAACAGIIALGGDLPPDVAANADRLPPVLIGRGHDDEWYGRDTLAADRARLIAAGVSCTVCEFEGGHEWGDVFVTAAARWLALRRA